MSDEKSRFVYVIYIRTTPQKLWQALTQPEFTRRYWVGTWQDCDWREGAEWKLMIPDGRVGDAGQVLEIDPPKRLVLSWQNQFLPGLKAEGHSRCTYEIVEEPGRVKLTIVHEMERKDSQLIAGVSNGWPPILSSLKSLLETGEPLLGTSEWPRDI